MTSDEGKRRVPIGDYLDESDVLKMTDFGYFANIALRDPSEARRIQAVLLPDGTF